ncbi:MAG: carboxylesterase family protein [Steroidobacter sp.]
MRFALTVSTLLTCLVSTTGLSATMNTITVSGGKIAVTTPAADGVRAYKGLPYAAPPVGALRWHAPAPVPKWTGIRHADHFAPNCLQPKLYSDIDPFIPSMSEDCLYLNVWTKAKPGELLPVFVWIHGGGYEVGSGSELRHDGSALARKGVVVVTINYRLGPFGFLAHPELTAESPHHASGNYAFMDMIAALRWVQNNITAFGGDPDRVTIAGESAGSEAVNTLMASPQAKGLFQRAIGESGSAFEVSNKDESLHAAEQQGVKFMHAIGAASLAQLRQRSSAEILALWKAPDTKWSFRPAVDGWILPSSVNDIFRSGKQNDVPLLAGWNADEGFTFIGKLGNRKLDDVLKTQFGNRAAAAMKFYPASDAEQEHRSRMRYAGDITMSLPTWKWAVAQTMTGHAPVYLYRFDHHPPVPDDWFGSGFAVDQAGAFHSAEINYVFDHPGIIPSWKATTVDHQLADIMSSYWVGFAKSGDPNYGMQPVWPKYNLADPQRMVFSAQPHGAKDDEVERHQFLDTAPVPPDL